MQVRSVEPRTLAMQLLAKAANGSDSEKETVKRELITNAVQSAQKRDWNAVSDYATAAFTAGLITPAELVDGIASAIVDSLDKRDAKTQSQEGKQGKVDDINTTKLREDNRDRGRSFAIFSAREELFRLAREGNEPLRTLFPRPDKTS